MKIVRSSSRTCSARFAPGQNQLLANLSLLLFFKDLSIVRFYDFKKNFRGMCFTVQLSKIGFRIAVCLKQLCYYIMSFPVCQELFSTFLKLFSLLSCSNFGSISCLPLSCQELFSRNFSVFTERRRRDLNPRAATNDLLPFQGSPFSHLGTSPAEFIKCIQFIELLLETEKVGFEPTAPFGVTGFQDRLLKPLGHLSTVVSRTACGMRVL